MLFNGGVSLDGLLPITPDRLDLVQVMDAQGNLLPSNIVLGLADLGTDPAPKTPCEKENWPTDGDNYLDICLNIPKTGFEHSKKAPFSVYLPCGPDTQITPPKGLNYPCLPQSVLIEN